MIRATLSTLCCLCALGLGLWTVYLSAKNRARAADLDSFQRWCEIFGRQSEAMRAENRSGEWQLLSSVTEDEQ